MIVGFYFIYRNGQVVKSQEYVPGAAPEHGSDVIFGVSNTAGVTDKSLWHPGTLSSKVTEGSKADPPLPSSALWWLVQGM